MTATITPTDPLIYLITHIDRVKTKQGCWLWTGRIGRAGYGQWKQGCNAGRVAHRVVYELLVGPVDSALQLDHLCRVRRCVNPQHLDPVTKRVNDERGMSVPAINARKTECKRGHPFTLENTLLYRGSRHCRACTRLRQREKADAKRIASEGAAP